MCQLGTCFDDVLQNEFLNISIHHLGDFAQDNHTQKCKA